MNLVSLHSLSGHSMFFDLSLGVFRPFTGVSLTKNDLEIWIDRHRGGFTSKILKVKVESEDVGDLAQGNAFLQLMHLIDYLFCPFF